MIVLMIDRIRVTNAVQAHGVGNTDTLKATESKRAEQRDKVQARLDALE